MAINITPFPITGQGIYGKVPGLTELPDPYADLAARYPGLNKTNAALSGAILNQLAGVLSPDTIRAIQDASARFGVSSGMPGSGLQGNRTARDLGLTSQQLQQQGITNYNATIPTIKSTQTVSPETQIGLAQANATLASAPDPALAGQHAEELFKQYLEQQSRTPAGGTGIRTGGGGLPVITGPEAGTVTGVVGGPGDLNEPLAGLLAPKGTVPSAVKSTTIPGLTAAQTKFLQTGGALPASALNWSPTISFDNQPAPFDPFADLVNMYGYGTAAEPASNFAGSLGYEAGYDPYAGLSDLYGYGTGSGEEYSLDLDPYFSATDWWNY